MTNPAEYLETEFRRYFPDASVIAVGFDDETTNVIITLPSIGVDHWVCTPGSDDNWFLFESPEGSIITIPFYPDMGE